MSDAPLAAYQQSLRAQHPHAHAPSDCPCKDGHDYQPVPRGHFPRCARSHAEYLHPVDARLGTTCADCDPRLAPDAPLPPEVQAAVEAGAWACVEAARRTNDAWCHRDTNRPTPGDAMVAVEAAARECGVEIPR